MIFQTKQPEELEQLLAAVTDSMEAAASTADISTARGDLKHSIASLGESLALPDPADGCSGAGERENTVTIEFH